MDGEFLPRFHAAFLTFVGRAGKDARGLTPGFPLRRAVVLRSCFMRFAYDGRRLFLIHVRGYPGLWLFLSGLPTLLFPFAVSRNDIRYM